MLISCLIQSLPSSLGKNNTHGRAFTLQWRYNGRDSVSNHQPHNCLPNRLFRRISKKTSKLRVAGLCAGNSPGTGEFPAQMASHAENVWWRHHVTIRHSSLYIISYISHVLNHYTASITEVNLLKRVMGRLEKQSTIRHLKKVQIYIRTTRLFH